MHNEVVWNVKTSTPLLWQESGPKGPYGLDGLDQLVFWLSAPTNNICMVMTSDGINHQFGIQEWTPLMFAIHHNRVNVMCKLLEMGADPTIPSRGSRTPLMAASLKRRPEFLNRLLTSMTKEQLHQTLNCQDAYKCTALHFATSNVRAENVKQLLDAKADVNVMDEDGQTALQDAIRAQQWSSVVTPEQVEIVRLLTHASRNGL